MKTNGTKEPDHTRKDNLIPKPGSILYGVRDVPSLPLCLLFGLQQATLCLSGPLAMSFILSGLLCASGDGDVTYTLMSISMFMSGIATILQTIFGLRLGVIQSSAFAFVAPIVAMMTLDKWSCPNNDEVNLGLNDTGLELNKEKLWKSRMREVYFTFVQLSYGMSGVLCIHILLSVGISWLVCYILTVSEVFSDDPGNPSYLARTDARIKVLETAPWFYWPYPFQFGMPTFSAAGYVGFLAATLASIIESVGDYHAAARICGIQAPPAHAINRGVAMEGLSSIISGMVGAGHGTTTYSGNIGAIGITKVASRAVFITAGMILILCGVVGKLGAFLILMPYPVVGGTSVVPTGMVIAVGISTLKFIDLESTRNLTIIGTSLILGLMVPQYMNDPQNAALIDTGNEELDQVLKVLLGTSMFVGGFVGFLLDNTVSGTDEERGILLWRKRNFTAPDTNEADEPQSIYEYPFVTKYLKRVKFCSHIPISPTFDKDISCNCFCCQDVKHNISREEHLNQYAFDNTESFDHSTNLDVKL